MNKKPRQESATTRDIVVLVIFFFSTFAYLTYIDAFELIVDFVHRHESWQLDELLTSIALIGFGGFVFGARRYGEARSELRKRRSAEADVSWLAHYDPLTELPNRRRLNDFVREFDHSVEANGHHAVFSIDLDGFKKVNDLHGHAAGDRLLTVVSERLVKIFPADLVVRLGGDEFVVIARSHRGMDVSKIAKRIATEIRVPIDIDRIKVEVGASIGVVTYPDQSTSMEDALGCSDIAMYSAKKQASTHVALFHPDMRDEFRKKAELEMQFRSALSADAIEPYYQPLVDLQSNEIYGFEVLARWTLPSGEQVPPTDFIPLAEEFGLISEMSEQLLRKACRDAQRWPEHILLSFNLSPVQIADRLIVLRIINILNETGFEPARLEVEITESAMILDPEAAQFVLDGLQTLGIRVALDDFGTGYSSLSQMSKFKFNRLKIDKGFVHDFENDEKQKIIVKAIIALGVGLNVAITAEGIEEPSQLAALKLLGCNSGQGFLLGRPMTADHATQLLSGPVKPSILSTRASEPRPGQSGARAAVRSP
ncbi:EAL domain-containing protein [Hoeflea sp.]|uniref:putative bifunctional diguanylate cyclase/phosphodiesterase n=1 Tax=Hoeflea sp. TaxID=1940281 RepID=UPI0019C61226|nr:EAL domain-containing protein [Hoeflea sp.]MBC7281214.1 EAL domain-containing protein [Hoeflea sp.]